MSALKIGSTWRKWDLHVHTPASIVQNYGGNTEAAWETFLADLEKLPPEFKVIGINDYLFVDGYERVLKEKESGRLANIDLILPVVELRLDKFGGVVKQGSDGTSQSDWSRVNLHVIFDQLDPEVIRQQFLSALAPSYHLIPEAAQSGGEWHAVITPDSLAQLGKMIIDAAPAVEKKNYGSPLQEGFNNLCVSLENVVRALERHPLKGRFLLAVGKTEWENMKWNDQSIADKRNVINKVDLVFTASDNPAAYAKAREKLVASNVLATLLDCSDAHTLSNSGDKDRIGNCFTWIKADPTFQGLLQAVTEFEQRVFVGDMPPKQLLVNANRTKYVSSISIKKRAGSSLVDTWFDLDLPLNSDLVAIIGNKGSGKSALADVIALVGDTKNFASFSFLRDNRFRDPKARLASNFVGSIRWGDGEEISRDLNVNPSSSSVERIKYLPQSYLESLCNELAGSGSSTFDNELRKIIYTHVPEEERIGFGSLDALLAFKVSELEDERRQIYADISKINAEVVGVEKKMSREFKQSLVEQQDAKKRELAALENAKPFPVEDPLQSEEAKREAAETTAKLAELEGRLSAIRGEEEVARRSKADALRDVAHATRIVQAIRNHQKGHEQFLSDLDAMLREMNSELTAAQLVSMDVDAKPLQEVISARKQVAEAQDAILIGEGVAGIAARRSVVEAEINAIKALLGERQRLYLVYREQLVQWERAKAELQGSKDKVNSLTWLQMEINALEKLPARHEDLKANRISLVRRMHEQIQKVVTEYATYYQPVRGFVQSTTDMGMSLPLDFNVQVAEEGFQEAFLGRINRQSRGSFSGVDESNALVGELLKETEFSDVDSLVRFVSEIDDKLHFDRRSEDGEKQVAIAVSDQLRKGGRVEDLYDFVFGLEYLRPQYSLTYGKQEIGQLSPGERGLLLLVFYLLVDKDDIPLVIDQPEENLDNQTIYKVVVTCIKAAKQRRQVIMVTHNPNLAVVCDAEQIVYAACDKAEKAFSYESGAIEAPEIKARIVEILEGTKPAFVNRKRKYGF